MDTKIGVYICKGCDIAKTLDIDQLVEDTNDETEASICKTHDVLCSQEGIASIQADIDGEGVDRVVVAACSPRVFSESFDFGGDVLTDRANLREQVAWCHTPDDEDTQMLGQDQIRMSVAKVGTVEPPEALIEETSKDLMIVGGGMTGMTAAKSAAAAGYKVALVEKEDRLGGWATRFSKVFPKHPPYKELEDTGCEKLVGEVESDPNITVHKSTTVGKTVGQPGQFAVELQNGGSSSEITVGSIILASGWKPYEAEKLTHLGYGSSPDVITNIQMEEMVGNGGIKRPSDSKPPESVAFIQCAGSRDQEHLPYCSAVCCRVSLKQAMYVREQHPGAKVYIIYKDLRSPAQYERFYANVQEDAGIFLTKGEIADVAPGSDGQISVRVEETLLGENIEIKADMVVLATGMVPTTKVGDIPGLDAAEADAGEEEQAGYRSADTEVRLPRLALHLLPVRDAAHRHLCRGRRPGADGSGRVRQRRQRCGSQVDPGGRVGSQGSRSASARRRSELSGLLHAEVHAVQAVHRGMSIRCAGRGREGHSAAESAALPPLRHLLRRLSGADHLVQELHRPHGLADDQGDFHAR